MIIAYILAGVGVLISGMGIAIFRGNTELLAQYPENSGPKELATRSGGIITAYGLLTIGAAPLLAQTGATTLVWSAWTLLTLVVAFGVAGLTASYTDR